MKRSRRGKMAAVMQWTQDKGHRMSKLAYRRILLKISGESLSSPGGMGVEGEAIAKTARRIQDIAATGVELAVVIGGGNWVRGAKLGIGQIDAATADYMGMMGTIMNAVALQDACEKIGLQTRVLSSLAVPRVCEEWIRRRAMRHLEKGRVIILAAGTGNPHVTTDTAAAQRAKELGCDVLIKATTVDGIYDRDPRKNPGAMKFDKITYHEVLVRNLKVMDATAFAMCQQNRVPILVINMDDDSALRAALNGERVGTLVTDDAGHGGR